LLRSTIEAADSKFVTVEMEEIACMGDEEGFYDQFRAALAGIGGDYSTEARSRLIDIAQFEKLTRFPPARLQLDAFSGQKFHDEDYSNHCRVFGAGWVRPVAWERA